MSTNIYYFTGTGNSMAIARKLGEKLGDAAIVSIPNIIDDEKPISGDVIGIVCPIYMYNMPLMVADFIAKITEANYIFFVYAGAGKLGYGDKAAEKRFTAQNLKCSALFNIPMPSNYSPYGSTSPQRKEKMFKNLDSEINRIVGIVKAKKEHTDGNNTTFFQRGIHPGILYKMGYGRINIMDKSFTSGDTCNGCGICQKVCPVNNVVMKDNKPVWNNQCQQCYACLQWCPQESIEAGKASVGVERYHHPDIKVKDIIAASPVKDG